MFGNFPSYPKPYRTRTWSLDPVGAFQAQHATSIEKKGTVLLVLQTPSAMVRPRFCADHASGRPCLPNRSPFFPSVLRDVPYPPAPRADCRVERCDSVWVALWVVGGFRRFKSGLSVDTKDLNAARRSQSDAFFGPSFFELGPLLHSGRRKITPGEGLKNPLCTETGSLEPTGFNWRLEFQSKLINKSRRRKPFFPPCDPGLSN